MKVGTNILIHPDTTGPGKFGRRLRSALAEYGITLLPGPVGPVFLASSILQPHEYNYVGRMKILHRVDNTGEMYPWDGKHWTPDTRHVQYVYERADKHIFQTEWSARQFAKLPKMFSEPKDYTVAFNGVPLRELDAEPRKSYTMASICNTWNMTRMHGYFETFVPHFREIIKAIPNFQWMIVGKVGPLIEQLGFRGLSKYVGAHIIPMPYPADLHNIRSIVDGFIHLVYQDSCPNSVTESLMYSLPGIVLMNSGARELVGDAGFAMGQTPTADDFILALQTIFDNEEEYRRKAHAQASNHLDIHKVAGVYAEELRKLA